MSLLGLVIFILVIGILIYCINRFAPIPEVFKQIILWVGIAVVVIVVLQAFGIIDAVRGYRVPRL